MLTPNSLPHVHPITGKEAEFRCIAQYRVSSVRIFLLADGRTVVKYSLHILTLMYLLETWIDIHCIGLRDLHDVGRPQRDIYSKPFSFERAYIQRIFKFM